MSHATPEGPPSTDATRTAAPATTTRRRILALGRWLARLVPLALTIALLLALEAASTPPLPTVQQDPGRAATEARLILVWFDSLSTRDLDNPQALRRTKARLGSALHGPVRECVDAISVPCFSAMSTGVDRFSLFAMFRNFGDASGMPAGSVFRVFHDRGMRLGFIGDPQVAPLFRGFDWSVVQHDGDDIAALDQGMAALDRERLDVVVIHLREADEISHKEGPASREYADALERFDLHLQHVFERLRPGDNLIVLGDHGHTEDGRHFAGLDVPTYSMAWGPFFARPGHTAMSITDHAAVWGRVFGVRFGQVAWLDDYLEGRPLPPVEPLPTLAGGNHPIRLWVTLLALPAALAVGFGPALRRRDLVSTALLALLAVLLFGVGANYASVQPVLYALPDATKPLVGLATAGLGLLAVRVARRLTRDETDLTPEAGLLGASLTATLPTLYKFGGFFSAACGLFIESAVVAFSARSRRSALLVALAPVALLGLVWDARIRNFSLLGFPAFSDIPAWAAWLVTALLWLLLLARALPRTTASLTAASIGMVLAGTVDLLPPRLYIIPCVAFPLLAAASVRSARWLPHLLAVAPAAMVFFFRGDPGRVGPLVAVILGATLWLARRGGRSDLATALGATIWVWALHWTLFGGRISGINFNYFFAWLPPGGPVESTWAINATLTTLLYISPIALVLAVARRLGGPDPALLADRIRELAALKMSLVLVLIVGFYATATPVGPFVTADVLSETMNWAIVMLAMLTMPLTPSPAQVPGGPVEPA
jgi:hypothetical protein